MLQVLKKSLQYIEEQNAWISCLQMIISQKEENYKTIHSMISKEILKEFVKAAEDEEEEDVQMEEDKVQEVEYCDFIKDIEPVEDVQNDAEKSSNSDSDKLPRHDNKEGKHVDETEAEVTIIKEDQDEIEINYNSSYDCTLTEDGGKSNYRDIENETTRDTHNHNGCKSESNTEIINNGESLDSEGINILERNCKEVRVTLKRVEIEKQKLAAGMNQDKLNGGKDSEASIVKLEPEAVKEFMQQKKTRPRNVDKSQRKQILTANCSGGASSDSAFKSKTKFRMPVAVGKKKFQCEYCKKRFTKLVNVKYHMQTHGVSLNGCVYKCKHCTKSFSGKGILKNHMRLHIAEDKFECTYKYCEQWFNTSVDLNLHMLTHDGEKPYKCTSCGELFKSYESRRVHKQTHVVQKPFKCKYCQKSFTNSGNCRKHMLTHTGEKPFKCKYCLMSFTTSARRHSHIRSTHYGH